MRNLALTAFLLILAALGSSTAAAERTVNQTIDETLGDHVAYERVILATQKAIAARDAAALAALVRYPIKVEIRGRARTIATPAAFVAHYDKIITPAIARVVLAECYNDLFVNYQGVMFGQGEIWIGGVCHDDACRNPEVKIITIQSRSPLSPSASR